MIRWFSSNRWSHVASVASTLGGLTGSALLLLVLTAPGLAAESWLAMSTQNAPRTTEYTAVWTGSKMIVWGGRDGYMTVQTGGIYDPASNTWTATSTANAPWIRSYHTAVWTGSKMIVWGGNASGSVLNDGGVYDPATDTWTRMSTTNAPEHRFEHTAVWTGSRMIVWGGITGDYRGGRKYLNTGGIYDPTTDTWTQTSTLDAPAGRYGHTAVWTGGKMIVWGGQSRGTGGIYDPATDTWTATSTTNAPTGSLRHAAVWTGAKMIIWGGWSPTGGSYDPETDTWTATSMMNAPGAGDYQAVWTGASMIVWGGDQNAPTGHKYDPATDSWTALSTTNAPTEPAFYKTFWTGAGMIAWGAQVKYLWRRQEIRNMGGIYSPCGCSAVW